MDSCFSIRIRLSKYREIQFMSQCGINFSSSIWRTDNAVSSILLYVCRHAYCSNVARARMNPKALQYLMGHSDIPVTMNTYTHLGFDDAKDEMVRLEELEAAKKEVEKAISQKMFKAI